MSTVVAGIEPRVSELTVTDAEISARLVDGRTVSVPLSWSWRLSEATPEQRNRWELLGDGTVIHWPDLDEDISVEGMLWGTPAPRPALSARALSA